MKLLMLPQQGAEDERAQAYRISGQSLLTNGVLQELAAFKQPESVIGRSSPARHAAGLQTGLVYQGPGWIANRWRKVECYSSPAGYRVAVCGAGAFLVAPDGHTIYQTEAEPSSEHDVLVETMLGPVLILALALQATWCLHASAVSFGGHSVAFAGESGNGKSTLAAFLGAGEAERWRHVADDILPVELRAGHLEALPHFPQLKLPTDEQPAAGLPERLPIGALYVLSRAAAGQTGVELGPMSRQEATLALVRHTVAARLFDPDLLARHLAFCGGAASAIPVRRLAYAHEPASLPRAREALAADLRVLTLPTPRGCHG